MTTPAWTLFSAISGARALQAAGGFAGLLLLAGAVLPSMAQERAGFIIWNLPPKDSDAYRRLRDLASVIEAKALTKTGAEMWAVEAARESELRRACDEQGVQISVIGDQLNALVASIAGRVENDETTPPPQTHMPIVQSAMRHAAGENGLLNLRDPAAADHTSVQRGSSPCPFDDERASSGH
jgi:hypothetical protein